MALDPHAFVILGFLWVLQLVAEVELDILLATKHCSPRRCATGTIAYRSENSFAFGVGFSSHPRRSSSRTRDSKLGMQRDPAVVLAVALPPREGTR